MTHTTLSAPEDTGDLALYPVPNAGFRDICCQEVLSRNRRRDIRSKTYALAARRAE